MVAGGFATQVGEISVSHVFVLFLVHRFVWVILFSRVRLHLTDLAYLTLTPQAIS